MDEIGLDELLQLIIKEKGGAPQQYNKMMDYIAFHETGHKQRMDPKAKQISGNEKDGFYDGPGRGLFQFEVGEKKGGNTAVNRTVRYFKDNNLAIPKWLHDVSMGSAGSKSVDVSDLSADQQKMLFLGYHKGHPVSDFSKVWNNEQTIQDFWAENHWAGDKENLTAKLALFNKNITAKDSIDALNIRKAELFGQDDKVPFQSAQKDPNRLPTESDILKRIFGQQTSSIVDKYKNGGKHSDKKKKVVDNKNLMLDYEDYYYDDVSAKEIKEHLSKLNVTENDTMLHMPSYLDGLPGILMQVYDARRDLLNKSGKYKYDEQDYTNPEYLKEFEQYRKNDAETLKDLLISTSSNEDFRFFKIPKK